MEKQPNKLNFKEGAHRLLDELQRGEQDPTLNTADTLVQDGHISYTDLEGLTSEQVHEVLLAYMGFIDEKEYLTVEDNQELAGKIREKILEIRKA